MRRTRHIPTTVAFAVAVVFFVTLPTSGANWQASSQGSVTVRIVVPDTHDMPTVKSPKAIIKPDAKPGPTVELESAAPTKVTAEPNPVEPPVVVEKVSDPPVVSKPPADIAPANTQPESTSTELLTIPSPADNSVDDAVDSEQAPTSPANVEPVGGTETSRNEAKLQAEAEADADAKATETAKRLADEAKVTEVAASKAKAKKAAAEKLAAEKEVASQIKAEELKATQEAADALVAKELAEAEELQELERQQAIESDEIQEEVPSEVATSIES